MKRGAFTAFSISMLVICVFMFWATQVFAENYSSSIEITGNEKSFHNGPVTLTARAYVPSSVTIDSWGHYKVGRRSSSGNSCTLTLEGTSRMVFYFSGHHTEREAYEDCWSEFLHLHCETKYRNVTVKDSGTALITVKIDLTAPSISPVLTNGFVRENKLYVDVSDGFSGVASVEYAAPSNPANYIRCIKDTVAGRYYCLLTEPTGVLHLRCTDVAGNTANLDVPYTIDGNGPEIVSLSGDADWTRTDTILLQIKDDIAGLANSKYSFDKSNWLPVQKNPDGNYYVTIPPDRMGKSILYVQADDRAGNTTLKEFDFTLPTISTISLFNGQSLNKPYDGNVSWSSTSIKAQFIAKDSNSGLGAVFYQISNDKDFDENKWKIIEEGYDGRDSYDFSILIDKEEFLQIASMKEVFPLKEHFTGDLYFKIKDKAGNYIIQKTPVKIDTCAPSLSIHNPSDGEYQTKDVTVKAIAEDGPGQSGGVLYRYVVKNDEKIIEEGQSDTVTVKSEGDNEVIFYAVDSAGNETNAATRVRIDRTGPEIILSSSVEDGQWATSSTISMTVKDGLNKVDEESVCYAVYDENSEKLKEGKISPVIIKEEGNLRVEFFARDNLGNETTKSIKLLIDNTEPAIDVNAAFYDTNGTLMEDRDFNEESLSSNVERIKLSFTGKDEASKVKGIWYKKINESAYTQGDSMEIAAHGTTVIEIKAEDHAGNISRITKTVILDKKAPVIKLKEGYWSNQDMVVVSVLEEEVTDDGLGVDFSSMEYRIGSEGEWTKGKSASVSLKGSTVVYFRVKDRAGNFGEASTIAGVDKTLPKVSTLIKPENVKEGVWTNTKNITVHMEFSDEGGSSLVESRYSLDKGETWTVCKNHVSDVSITKPGENSIWYEAKDKAGNVFKREGKILFDPDSPLVETIIKTKGVNKEKWTREEKVEVYAKAYDELSGVDEETWSYFFGKTREIMENGSLAAIDAEGKTALTFEVLDKAGNKGMERAEVWIDRTPPLIKELKLQNTYISKSITITSLVCEDNLSGIEKNQWSIKGQTEWRDYKTGQLILVPSDLKDGHYELLLKTVDFAGNERIINRSVILDRALPQVMSVKLREKDEEESPEVKDGQYVIKDKMFAFIDAKDLAAGTEEEMAGYKYILGKQYQEEPDFSKCTYVEDRVIPFGGIENGTMFLYIKAVDKAGNESKAYLKTLKIDMKGCDRPEVIGKTHPLALKVEDAVSEKDAIFSLVPGKTGVSGVKEYRFELIKGAKSISQGKTNIPEIRFSNLDDNLQDEFYILKVYAVSGSGIVSESTQYQFRVDTKPPEKLKITSTTHGNPLVWYKASSAAAGWQRPLDFTGVKSYYYKVSTSLEDAGKLSDDLKNTPGITATRQTSLVLDLKKILNQNSGTVYLTLWAEDFAGNRQMDRREFRIDTLLPDLKMLPGSQSKFTIEPDAAKRCAKVTWGEPEDNIRVSHVELGLRPYDKNTYHWMVLGSEVNSETLNDLEPGQNYVFCIRILDAAGNERTYYQAFNLSGVSQIETSNDFETVIEGFTVKGVLYTGVTPHRAVLEMPVSMGIPGESSIALTNIKADANGFLSGESDIDLSLKVNGYPLLVKGLSISRDNGLVLKEASYLLKLASGEEKTLNYKNVRISVPPSMMLETALPLISEEFSLKASSLQGTGYFIKNITSTGFENGKWIIYKGQMELSVLGGTVTDENSLIDIENITVGPDGNILEGRILEAFYVQAGIVPVKVLEGAKLENDKVFIPKACAEFEEGFLEKGTQVILENFFVHPSGRLSEDEDFKSEPFLVKDKTLTYEIDKVHITGDSMLMAAGKMKISDRGSILFDKAVLSKCAIDYAFPVTIKDFSTSLFGFEWFNGQGKIQEDGIKLDCITIVLPASLGGERVIKGVILERYDPGKVIGVGYSEEIFQIDTGFGSLVQVGGLKVDKDGIKTDGVTVKLPDFAGGREYTLGSMSLTPEGLGSIFPEDLSFTMSGFKVHGEDASFTMDGFSFGSIEIELPQGFSQKSLKMFNVVLGPKGLTCTGLDGIEVNYTHNGWNFALNHFAFNESGLTCDGKVEVSKGTLKAGLIVKSMGIMSDGSFRMGAIEGNFHAKLHGIDCDIYHLTLTKESLQFDADIKSKVFGENKVEAKGIVIDPEGRIQGTVSVPTEFSFTSSNGFTVKLSNVIVSHEGIRLKGEVTLPDCLDSGKTLSFKEVELILEKDGSVTASAILPEAQINIGGFKVTGKEILLKSDGVHIGKGVVDIMNPGHQVEFTSLYLDAKGGLLGEVSIENLPEFERFGWYFTIKKLILSKSGLKGDFDVHLPEVLGGSCIRFTNAAFTPYAPYVKMDTTMEQLSFNLGQIVFDLQNVQFSLEGITAVGGSMAFNHEGAKTITLPGIKIFNNGKFQVTGPEIPAFTLWDYEVHVTSFDISDEKVKMQGWLKTGEDFGIPELAGKRLDVESLVINKSAEVEYFDCVYNEGVVFDLASKLKADIQKIGINKNNMYVKNGSIVLGDTFPGFLSNARFNILELTLSHKGQIMSTLAEGIVTAGQGTQKVLGNVSFTSGIIRVQKKSSTDPIVVELNGIMTLPENLPGVLSRLEMNLERLVLNSSGVIEDIRAAGSIPKGGTLEAGVKVNNGLVTVGKSAENGKWLLGVSGSLQLPANMPGGLALAQLDILTMEIDPEAGLTKLMAKYAQSEETSFSGGLGLKDYTIACTQNLSQPMEIAVDGKLVLPKNAPGTLAGREITIQSLKFDTMGNVKEMKASTVLEGEQELVGGIRGKNITLRVDGLEEFSVGGSLILPSTGPALFRNAEINLLKFVIANDGSIKAIEAGLQRQGKFTLLKGIDVENPAIMLKKDSGKLVIEVSGNVTLGDSLPEGLRGLNLNARKIVFDEKGKLLSTNIQVSNINTTFFDSVVLMNGTLGITGGEEDLLFEMGGVVKLPGALSSGLGGRTFDVKKLVVSANSGLKEFTIHDPNGRAFDIFGQSIQGKFFEAGIGSGGLSLVGTVEFSSGFVIEGMRGTTIELKKFQVGWDGKIKDIDASILKTSVKFGGFTAEIENFNFHSDGISMGKLDIILPSNMNGKSFGLRNAGIRTDGSFYGGVALSDINIDYCGFGLRIESPELYPQERTVKFKSVMVKTPEVAGNKEFGLHGVKITPSGIAFTGGKFSLPNFSVGGLGFRDITVDFMIDGSKFRVEGGGCAFIPGAGALDVRVAFRNISKPDYPIGIEYAEFTYTLTVPGIPIANTGLFLYEISGGLYFGEPNDIPSVIRPMFDKGIRIRVGCGVHDRSGNLIDGKGDVWIDITNYAFAFRANVTVLKGMARGQLIAALTREGFYGEVSINVNFARGKVWIYVFPHNGSVAVSGGGDVEFGLRKGCIFKGVDFEVFGHDITLLPPIPWKDYWLVGAGAEFGLFRNGAKGVKGWVDVPVFGDIGAFVSSGGNIDFTNISDYQVYRPVQAKSSVKPSLEASSKDTAKVIGSKSLHMDMSTGNGMENLYAFDVPGRKIKPMSAGGTLAGARLSGTNAPMAPNADEEEKIERIIFVIGYVEGDPEVVLISPSGKEYKEGSQNILVQHVENGIIMAVLNPEPGQWTADVRNVPEGMYQVKAFGKSVVPGIMVETPKYKGEKADGDYQVTGKTIHAKPGSKVTIYATKEKKGFVGKPVAETVVNMDGSFKARFDTENMADGQYYVYGALEVDPDKPRILAYGEGTITVDNQGVPLKAVQNLILSENGKTALEVRFEDVNGERTAGFNMYVKNTVTDEEEVINLGYLTNVLMPGYKGKDSLEVAIAPYDESGKEGEKSPYKKVTIGEEKQTINSFELTETGKSIFVNLGEAYQGSVGITNQEVKVTGTAYDYADGLEVEPVKGIQLVFDEEAVNIAKEQAQLHYNVFVDEGVKPGEYLVTTEIQNRGNRQIKQPYLITVKVGYPGIVVGDITPTRWNNSTAVYMDVYGENFYEGTQVVLNEKILEIAERSTHHLKVLVPQGVAAGKTKLGIMGPGGDTIIRGVEIVEPRYSFLLYKASSEAIKGEKANFFFELAGDHGFNEKVEILSKDVLPGFVVTLDKPVLAPGELCTATVEVPRDAAEGSYDILLAAQNGKTITLTLHVVEADPIPYISSLYKLSVTEGETNRIFGYGFGEKGEVMLEGRKLEVLKYTKDCITVKIPENAKSGNVTVKTGDSTSNPVMMYIKKRSITLYSDSETVQLKPGEDTKVEILVKGSENEVKLLAETFNDDVRVSLDKSGVVPNASVTLSIYADKGALPGIYEVRIRAFCSKGEIEKSIRIEVEGEKTRIEVWPLEADGDSRYYVKSPKVSLGSQDTASGTFYKLNNGGFIKYTGPFTLSDGENQIFAYSVSAGGMKGKTVKKVVKVDSVPASSSLKVEGRYENGAYLTKSRLILTASDNTSGVRNVQFSLNNGEWKVYDGHIPLDTEGIWAIRWYAVDNAGNKENVRSTEIEIKKPMYTWYFTHGIKADPMGNAVIYAEEIGLGASNLIVSYRLENGSTKTTPMVLREEQWVCDIGKLVQGNLLVYSFKYTVNGKQFDTVWYRYVHRKLASPVYDCEFGVKHNPDGSVKVWVVPNGKNPNGNVIAGYRLRGSEYHQDMVKTAEGWEKEIKGIGDGERMQIRLFYNTSQGAIEIPWFEFLYKSSQTLNVGEKLWQDKNSPESTVFAEILAEGQKSLVNGYYNKSPRIVLKGRDSKGSEVLADYSLNGESPRAYQGEIRLTDGEYVIETYTQVNNKLQKTDEPLAVKVDTTAPSVECTLEGKPGYANTYKEMTVTLMSSDNLSGVDYIEYGVNGSGWIRYDKPILINRAGDHCIRYRGVDKAGNCSHEKQTGSILIR